MPESARWSACSPVHLRATSSRASRTPTYCGAWLRSRLWSLSLLLEERPLAIGELLPVLGGESVGIVDYLAFADCQLGGDSLRPRLARHRGIEDAEVALLHAQYGDIGLGAHIQVAKLRPLDLLRRRPGGHADHVVDRRAQGENRRHRVVHRLQAAVHAVDVQVGRDRVRLEPRL